VGSSTSSFSRQVPDKPWLKFWATATVLCVALLAGWELFLRSQGVMPAVSDSYALWSIERGKAGNYDRKQVVLVGASRMHVGADLDAIHSVMGDPKPIQLAIAGSSFKPVFVSLAEDPAFQGIAVVSINVNALTETTTDYPANQYVDYYERGHRLDMAVKKMTSPLYGYLSLTREGLDFRTVVDELHQAGKIYSHYLETTIDRSRKADYSLIDLESLRESQTKVYWKKYVNAMSEQRFNRFMDEMEEGAEKIRSRGGRVVLVSFPISGSILEFERKTFPREQYWDRWAARTSSIMIHYDDYPELAGFESPGYSHLDRKDTAAFSGALARVIVQKLEETKAAGEK